jgi:malonyl-CoA decarboxylase
MFESVQKRALAITPDGLRLRRLIVSCKKLLSERGEAAGVSQAKITRDLYRELDRKGQERFFAALLAEFSPDPMQVLAASKAYAAEQSAANLAQLSVAAEPPRQELLRRLNRAPGGTATILRMRERFLELKGEQRDDAVDHFRLLSSWFVPVRSFASIGTRPPTCSSRSSFTRRCTRSEGGVTCADDSRSTVDVSLSSIRRFPTSR